MRGPVIVAERCGEFSMGRCAKATAARMGVKETHVTEQSKGCSGVGESTGEYKSLTKRKEKENVERNRQSRCMEQKRKRIVITISTGGEKTSTPPPDPNSRPSIKKKKMTQTHCKRGNRGKRFLLLDPRGSRKIDQLTEEREGD